MASRIKVDEVTNLAQSGNVAFPTGGASFSGNVNVSGNIDFTGNLLQNGSPFLTLPTQDATNLGAVLRSGGTSEVAYWDTESGTGTAMGADQARYKAGFNITKGFSCCGYRGGTSYKNVNVLTHSTFSQVNLGDLTNWSGAYIDGKPGLTFTGFVFATGDGWNVTTSQVSKINMNTNSNSGAAASMAGTKHRATAMAKDFNFAYVHGGGNSSQMVKYNLNTESNAFTTTHPDGTQNNPASGQAATVGHIATGSKRSFNFTTESFAAWPDGPGTDGTNKTLSSRDGFQYWNTGGGYRTSSDWHLRDSYTGGR